MSYGTTTIACSGLQFGCTYPASVNNTLATSPQLLLTGSNLSQAAAAAAVAAVTSSASSSSTCCENGRPIVTDPCTGQSTCTCQIHPALLPSYPRVPSLMDHLCNTTGLSPTSLLGAEPSAFYPPLKLGPTSGYDLERSAEAWKSLAAATGPPTCYTYDTATLAAHSYNSVYPNLDYNSATRRKNATRETTNALKAWLYEHRKNPYPTKGEKIMLAIITKMTLTQVSTWFANARRRLKKENKMTWSNKDKDDDTTQDKDDVMSHDQADDFLNGRDDNAREDSSSSFDEDEKLDVSSLDEKEDTFPNCLPTAGIRDSDIDEERPSTEKLESSSPIPLTTNELTRSTPAQSTGSHTFYRYDPVIQNDTEPVDKQHSPKIVEAGRDRTSSKINKNNREFNTTPIDGATKDPCSPPVRRKSRSEDELSPSKNQNSETVQAKPKIWSISNIMNTSSTSSKPSPLPSCSSNTSSSLNSNCHLSSKNVQNKISGRVQLPSDAHLSTNRPSILNYDSAMSRERMCALQIYLPPHEVLTNAFAHSAHADLASFRNLCVASNHPLETPPHTPPERQGGSQFDVNCPQHSSALEASATLAAAAMTNIALPPTTGQSRDINGLSLVKTFHKIPK